MLGYVGGCWEGVSYGPPFYVEKVEGSCRRPSWPFTCPHGQLTAIRLAPSCFRKSIIFANVGIPNILYRNLKGMRARMALWETSTMLTMAPDQWEYVVRQFLSRSTTCQ